MSDLSHASDQGAWSGTNPFNVTKATDLTDEEIQRMWVDLGADGGYLKVIDPTVSMPRFLLGGKGTGRTHLMRYLSAPIQYLRYPEKAFEGPLTEGYLGIYLRCTGLNAGRFQGKGIPDETWDAIFTYSMDLWLGRLALTTVCSAFGSHPEFSEEDSSIARAVADAFDDYGATAPDSVRALQEQLATYQASLDLAVNNAALTKNLRDVTIRIGRGKLPFVIPQIIASHVAAIRNMSWLYLVDELENLTESQQRYIQTLIREREAPASFIVGTRTYGLRTRLTLSAGEENKEGSEYSAVELDRLYLSNPNLFGNFCSEIIARRLVDAGYTHIVANELDRYFYQPSSDGAARDGEVAFVTDRDEGERRYLLRLRKQLEEHRKYSPESAARIAEKLQIHEHPLLERLNVLLLYQAWTSPAELDDRAAEIGDEARLIAEGKKAESYTQSLKHYGSDVLAKLLQEYGQKQRYLGLDTYIRMAGGLPRSLLIILKNVVRAAEFNGEAPFRDVPIAESSQRAGVIRAAEWFYRDARAMGEAGVIAERAVKRIADLMRALRFADKPPEVSLSSFSLDFDALGPIGQEALRTARDWSLLLEVPQGQRDKNTAAVRSKFQLNPMLCPRWDLPIVRRGTLNLQHDEAKAIFCERSDDDFDEVRKVRMKRATVPFSNGNSTEQESLLDDGD